MPTQPANPMWQGAKVFVMDVGLSTVIQLVLAVFLIAAGLPIEVVMEHSSLAIAGLFVSMYMTYLLYRRYTQEIYALGALFATAGMWWILNTYFEAAYVENFNLQKDLLFTGAQVLAYLIGWNLAKTTEWQIYIPTDGWLKVAFIVGVIALLISLLGVVSMIN